MALEQYVAQATQSFTMPDICIRLRTVLDDPRSDISDIGKLISVDPSLSGKILKLANSALFRFASQVTSVEKAVMVIGGEALYNLVLAETASAAFQQFGNELLSVEAHWEKSVYGGMVAKYLAQQLKLRGTERFFAMGILRHFCELVVAKASPSEYAKYLDDKSNELPWNKQHKHFGFTFAEGSGTIMREWNLPMALHFPVTYLHDLTKQTSDVDVALLACASQITLKSLEPDTYGEIEPITPQQAGFLKLAPEALGNAATFAQNETGKVSSFIR